MARLHPLLLACLLAVLPAQADETYTASIDQWHGQRVARLTTADGWLTLVGRGFLKEGANTVGSAAGNDIVLPSGPARLGVFTLDIKADRVTADFGADTAARVDGRAPVSNEQLQHDGAGKPTAVTCGTLTITVIRRGERTGLRTRDSASAARTNFAGIQRFPVDPAWRITAKWVPFEQGRKIKVENVIGQVSEENAPGKAVFEKDGATWELIPTGDDDQLFFVLRDATSGKETYGASRFLVADAPKDGTVILDFNKLYNPPCAFTDHATCPLPIPENRLKLAIRAGEKRYEGEPAH